MTLSAPLKISPRQRAARGVREMIAKGLVRTGDRLPAEESLAEQLSVSRATLRVALQQLESDGLIRRQKNCGCIVTARSEPAGGLMAQTIALLSDPRVASGPNIFSGMSEAVHSGAMDMAGRSAMNLLAMHSYPIDTAVIENLLASHPRGVVVTGWQHQVGNMKLLQRLVEGGVPVVAYGDEPHLAAFDRVASDHAGGAYELVKSLIAAGKKRILRLWTAAPELSFVRDHNAGYDRAIAEAGLQPLDAVYVQGVPDRDVSGADRSTFEQRTRYFAGHLVEHLQGKTTVDAIMVSTDCEVFPLAAACRLYGVADRVAITGYDNQWRDAFERQWEPAVPFATVEKHNHRIGEELVRLLIDRVSGALPRQPQLRVVPQEVIQIRS